MSAPESQATPYKELDYYEETDAKRFAGREQDIHQLFSRVVTCRAFVLYGRSGLGKTSVLLAGLFPQLRKGARLPFRPVYVRTLEEPLGDLKAAVLRDCGIAANGESLRAAIASGPKGIVPVIVLDQFEEFFLRFREQPAKRAAFVRELAAVIGDESLDIRVVFSVREDHLGALDDLQRRLPNLFAQSYRLMPLSAFGAREAIIRPLDDVPYDEMLVTRLVDELAKFDFESARLQITCAEVYRAARERSGGDLHLREEDLTKLGLELNEEQALPGGTVAEAQGNVEPVETRGPVPEGILERYRKRVVALADGKYRLLERLVPDEMVTRQETKAGISQVGEGELRSTGGTGSEVQGKVALAEARGALLEGIFQRYLKRGVALADEKYPLLARLVLDEMVTRQETKYAISESELARRVQAGEGELREVLGALVTGRLLREVSRANEPWFELMHECLVAEIRRWLATNEEFVKLQEARDMIVTGARRRGWFEKPAMLLSGESMRDVISPNREKLTLEPKEIAFLMRSAVYARAKDLRLWADKFGADQTTRLLPRLLVHAAPEMRAAAAAAVGTLNLRDPILVKRCRALALNKDEKPIVQRAAGRALAAVATDEELKPIREQCRWWRQPPHIRDLLADLAMANRLRPACHPWFRWRARKRGEERALREHLGEIKQEGLSNAQLGVFGGIFWGATAGFAAALFLNWVSNPATEKAWLPMLGGILLTSLGSGLVAGALVGWGVGQAHARMQVLARQPLWYRSVAKSRIIFFLYSAVGAFVGLNSPFVDALIPILVLALLWAWLARWFTAHTVQLCSNCFQPPITRRVVILWSIITGLVCCLLLTFLGFAPAASVLTSFADADDAAVSWVCLTMSVTLMVFVSNFTLGIRARQSASGGLPPSNRHLYRKIFGVASLVFFVLFLVLYGPSTTPLLPLEKTLPGDVVTSFRFRPQTIYYRLKSEKGAQFVLTAPGGAHLVLGARHEVGPGDYVLMALPTGVGSLAIDNHASPTLSESMTLRFDQVSMLQVKPHKETSEELKGIGSVHATIAVPTPTGITPGDSVQVDTKAGASMLTISVTLLGKLEPGKGIHVFLFDPEAHGFGEATGTIRKNQLQPWLSAEEQARSSKIEALGPSSKESFIARRATEALAPPSTWKVEFEKEIETPNPTEIPAATQPVAAIIVGIAITPLSGSELALDAAAFASRGKWEEAIAIQKRALALIDKKSNALALNSLAWWLIQAGRPAEALPLAREAVRKAENRNTLDTLAHAASGAGEWREAARAFQTIIDKNGALESEGECARDAQLYDDAKKRSAESPQK